MAKLDDLTGRRFGCLVVISRGPNVGKHPAWHCSCNCGGKSCPTGDALREGRVKSCGCAAKTQKGQSKSREFRIWRCMIARCHDPEWINYRFYGAIGIHVCRGWHESFDTFLRDMGRAPGKGYTIDRVDTKLGYTCGLCDECILNWKPMNCRWATKDEQARNAKNNRWYTYDGRTLILKDWAKVAGINYHTLYNRIGKGWTFEKAISTPARQWTSRD